MSSRLDVGHIRLVGESQESEAAGERDIVQWLRVEWLRVEGVIAERDGTEQVSDDAVRGYERSWIASTRSLDGGRYVKGWLNAEDAAVWDGTLGPLALGVVAGGVRPDGDRELVGNNRLADADRRARSLLFWSHANLYGIIEIGMEARLDLGVGLAA
ncbi:hypothetical protein [Actinomadura sp. 9N407]|uniref:hypothetical protein n=1 Tax=Actinomadura sp. 9N407 TaxID=3375154 RepID=UPI0037961938